MLLIVHPSTYHAERRYIFDVILRDFLGIEYATLEHGQPDVQIMLADDPNGRRICLPDNLFSTPKEEWLTASSMPKEPLGIFDISETRIEAPVVNSRIPVIYGRTVSENGYYSEEVSTLNLGLDIFGSAFFMLTRYEELVIKDRDEHDRFSAKSSLAFKEGFLCRPIINEYVEILWWALGQLNPNLIRKKRQFDLVLSHDVDWPISASRDVMRALKSAVGDATKRGDLGLALRRLGALPRFGQGRFDHDVNNTFDFIMKVSEEQGIASTFNIIADNTAGEIDGTYSLGEPWVQKMLLAFSDRGHYIGLHLSYNSFRDKEQTLLEFKKLKKECKKLKIKQPVSVGRQHFLRWENPTTWQNLEDAGIKCDSTLTYADRPGFRCGVCYEYPVFNLRTRQALKLRELPLVVMEGTLYDYMGLTHEEANKSIMSLYAKCKIYQGSFTLLWHNSELITKQARYWYKRTVDEICIQR